MRRGNRAMRNIPFIPIILLFLGGGVAIFLSLPRRSPTRTILFSDLSISQTQVVSVASIPIGLDWTVEGDVQGTGTVTIANQVLNCKISGSIRTNGTVDFYATNAVVVFCPDQAASGRLQVQLRFVGAR